MHLQEQDKILKLVKKVENYIEITNEKILAAGGYNLKGLTSLYVSFTTFQQGSP
jgi:hypothetical protein